MGGRERERESNPEVPLLLASWRLESGGVRDTERESEREKASCSREPVVPEVAPHPPRSQTMRRLAASATGKRERECVCERDSEMPPRALKKRRRGDLWGQREKHRERERERETNSVPGGRGARGLWG